MPAVGCDDCGLTGQIKFNKTQIRCVKHGRFLGRFDDGLVFVSRSRAGLLVAGMRAARARTTRDQLARAYRNAPAPLLF